MSLEERERRASAAEEADGAGRGGRSRAARRASSNLEFTRVISPIDGRVGRAIVTEGNLVSSGPGEATLLTTVVSLDPIYAAFDADEQTFLRYGDLARAGKRASARQSGVPIRMALAGDSDYPRRASCTSSTTRSIRRPARSAAAPSSTTPTGASRRACSCGCGWSAAAPTRAC